MKKKIADLLLVAGVIVAALAAGESRRVSKIVPVNGELVGAVLHESISSHLQESPTPTYVHQDRTLAAGTVLGEPDVAWLQGLGISQVSILRQPQSSEDLPVEGTAAQGRVLAGSLILKAELETARAGRILDAAFLERLEASGLESVQLSHEAETGGTAEESAARERLGWNFADPSANPPGLSPVGMRLEQEVSLPLRLKPATFLDPPTLLRIAGSGYQQVSVKIPRAFAWEQWGWRWVFVVGAALTLAGVLLKRARASGREVEAKATAVARLVEELVDLEEAVDELLPRLEVLDAEGLHAAVDPLLAGPAYRFAEGREAIRTAHGVGTYIAVMDAFARAERKLNRCWSAAVDGYAQEARSSLAAALLPLREAREALPGTFRPRSSGGGQLLDESGTLRRPPDVPLDLDR
jgi:hypothetical protein